MLVAAVLSVLAQHGFDLVLVHELDPPYVFLVELPLVVLADDLQPASEMTKTWMNLLVGQLVRADFVHLIQIDQARVLADVEVPHSVHLTPQAYSTGYKATELTVSRLIGLDDRRHEASNGK